MRKGIREAVRFSIRRKLTIALLFVGMAPLGVGMFFAYLRARADRQEYVGTTSMRKAQEKSSDIDGRLQLMIKEVRELARHPEVMAGVVSANRALEGKSDLEILRGMKEKDEEWLRSGETGGLVGSVLGGPTSRLLRAYQDRNAGEYGEIYLTDRWGGTVAATTRLTDYYQGDEGDWQAGYNRGRGRVWIEDRGYDRSAGSYVLGIVVPVMDEREESLEGILKANFNVMDAFNRIVQLEPGTSEYCFIARSQGTIVVHPERDPLSVRMSPGMHALTTSISPGWSAVVSEEGTRVIAGYAPVSRSLVVRTGPGRWVPTWWYVFCQVDEREALAPVMAALWGSMAVGVGLILAIFILAGLLARGFTRPVRRLVEGTERLARGELDHGIEVTGADEIAVLGRSFNYMARELEKAHTELAKANRGLRKLSDAKSRFLSTVSHEFRTPLVVMRSYADILAKKKLGSVSGEQEEKLKVIVRMSDYLGRLVDNLLNLDKIEAGKMKPELKAVSLPEIFEDSIERIAPLADDKQIKVQIDTDGPVPDVMGDEESLVHVLMNLLGNAVKFSPQGGTVIVRVRGRDGMVQIDVVDNGIGIPPGEHSRVFEEFHRVPGKDARPGWGAGLGLTIVKRFVEEQGGRVWVESEEHRGSTFSFTLPTAPGRT